MFTEIGLAYKQGRFKAPNLAVMGYSGEDLLMEEAMNFDHDADSKWFGSPEKSKKDGIQDDSMYTVGACIMGGRDITAIDFRERRTKINFGVFIEPAERPRASYH
jgi:hypothetical protein